MLSLRNNKIKIMIQLRQVYDGSYVIDVPEWNTLKNKRTQFMNDRKNPSFQSELYDALKAYINWFVGYCNSTIGNTVYSMDTVTPQLFIIEAKNEGQWKSYLRYSLYASRLYVQHIDSVMKVAHIDRYEDLIAILESDLEWLIINYEHTCCNENRPIHTTVGARKRAYPLEVLMLTERFFNIEEVPGLVDLGFFSLKPNILFLIRQLLELVGKNLIGYTEIVDDKGNANHQFTQAAWTFLAEKEKDRGKRWELSLPVKCSTIQKLNAWTNSFVHAGSFNMIWQQYYALEIVETLMKPVSNYVAECRGGKRQSIEFGDFRVKGYYWLRKDFESYVRNGAQRIQNPRVRWNAIDKVGVYVESYGKPEVLFVTDTNASTRESTVIGNYIKESSYLDRFLTKHVVDHNYSRTSCFECLRRSIKYIKGVVRCIKKEKPVAAYINPRISGWGLFVDAFLVQYLKLKMRRPLTKANKVAGNHPIILHFHNTGIKEQQHRKFYNWIYRNIFKNVYVLIIDSTQFDDIKTFVKGTDILLCPNGIKEYNRGMMPVRSNPSPQFIYVSDLADCKGVGDLLDACVILKNKGIDFGCTFIGSETRAFSKRRLITEIENRGLQNEVQYLGNLADNEIHKCLSIADVFVYPTYDSQECVPLVLLESMEQALPCITTNEAGIPNVIEDGVTGFMVDKQRPDLLADRMERLANNPNLRKQMGSDAKIKFEKEFTLTIFERNFMDCLNQMI